MKFIQIKRKHILSEVRGGKALTFVCHEGLFDPLLFLPFCLRSLITPLQYKGLNRGTKD